MKKQTSTLILLSWFLGNLSIHFLTPALPEIAENFVSTPRFTQLIIGLFLVGKACGVLIWCMVSERLGRKPVLILGLILYSLSNFLAAGSFTIYSLLFCRLLQGLAVGATLLMGRCIINETHNEQQALRQFSYLFTAAGVIICFLPLLGAFINSNFGWRIGFLIMGLYSFILLFFTKFDETKSDKNDSTTLSQSVAVVFKNRQFIGYLMIAALMMAGESAFNTSASFILIKGADYSLNSYGKIKTLMALMHLLGTATCGLLVRYFASSRLVGIGVYLFVITSICMGIFHLFADSISLCLILPMMIYYFGTGFIVASTAAAIVRPFPKQMVMAMALSLFFQFNFSALFSLLSGFLAIQQVTPFMFLISLISMLSFISWKFVISNNTTLLLLKSDSKQQFEQMQSPTT
ncbi:MFS transporter [Legionella hackeliae]|uniref:Drug resistance transporter, Bcr/CflA n=1 Tax=Legionella hackeliae TaxID=449 RepID=A0A0A8UZ14_LEGHA|nr:MFS transporter [Legionella hackeliae]KTD12583.1 drug resistance transporter, Bcr/CflA [Legionella hackeliae]CEK11999.1 Drug resistance transporter, Bcr/CflA [Legionella hackeliae]STX48781.1 drug resistance transporter, Bcr/CflA [Legionella hackeliae]